MSGRAVVAAGVLCVMGACLPGRHAVEGYACDEAHPCPDRLICWNGFCRTSPLSLDGGVSEDAGSVPGTVQDNVLDNGGFENGLVGWRPSSDATQLETSVEVKRGGAQAACAVHLDASSSRLGLTLSPNVLVEDAGVLWCAEAWVQRGTIRGDIALVLRAWSAEGDWEDAPPSGTSKQVLPDDDWHRFAAVLSLPAAFSHEVNLRFTTDNTPGGRYCVDDVRLWPSVDGGCP